MEKKTRKLIMSKKSRILKHPVRLLRQKINELGEYDDGKDALNKQSVQFAERYDLPDESLINILNPEGKYGSWLMDNGQEVTGTAFKQNGKIYVDRGDGNPVEVQDPNRVIYPRRYASSFDGSYSNFYNTLNAMTGGTIGMMPVLGDVLDLGMIGSDFYNKNYAMAGLGAGLFFVPNVLEKTIFRPIVRKVGNWIMNREFKRALRDVLFPENAIYDVSSNPSHNLIYTPSTQHNSTDYVYFTPQERMRIDPYADLHKPAETSGETGINLLDQAVQNSQIVRKDGSINFGALRHGINELSKLFPSVDQHNILNNRFAETYKGNTNSVENLILTNVTQNLLQHSLRTARAAQYYPVPAGFTRQQFVLAALFHDLGKISGNFAHGLKSVDLLKLLGTQNIDDDVYDAIIHHMDSNHMLDQSNLTRALHAVDVNQSMSPEIGFYINPLLVYPFEYYPAVNYAFGNNVREEAKNINKILAREGYPKIDINAPESEIRQQVQDRVERMNTWVRGVREPYDKPKRPNLTNFKAQIAELERLGQPIPDDRLSILATHTANANTGYCRNGFEELQQALLGVNGKEYDALYASNSPGTLKNFSTDEKDILGQRQTRRFRLRKPLVDASSLTENVLRNDPIAIRTNRMGSMESPMSVRAAVGREFQGQTGKGLSTAIKEEHPTKYNVVNRQYGSIQEMGNEVAHTDQLIKQVGGTYNIPVWHNGNTFTTKDLNTINEALESVSNVMNSKTAKLSDDFIDVISNGSTKFKRLLKVNPQYVLRDPQRRKKYVDMYVHSIYKSHYEPKYVVDKSSILTPILQVKFATNKGVVPSYMLPNFLNQVMYVQSAPRSIRDLSLATLGYLFGKRNQKLFDVIDDIPAEDILPFTLNGYGRDNKVSSRPFNDIFGLSNGAFDEGKDSSLIENTTTYNVRRQMTQPLRYNSGKDSGIHIKKKNRGKFTAAAKRAGMSVLAYARKILNAPKGKYSSTLRKRANFARNFAH